MSLSNHIMNGLDLTLSLFLGIALVAAVLVCVCAGRATLERTAFILVVAPRLIATRNAPQVIVLLLLVCVDKVVVDSLMVVDDVLFVS
jgi:ABC-type methionine transport system permease subunit